LKTDARTDSNKRKSLLGDKAAEKAKKKGKKRKKF
jgi:hypothetical protein